MAEAIVGPLLSKLQQVAVMQGKALAGVGNEIDRLRDKLMWLHALVHETDLRSRNDGNQLVHVLGCQMREVAFEAEDALDSFFLEADLSRFGHDWFRAAAKFFLNFGTQIRVRCILSGKIKSMNARLEDFVDSSTKYSTDSASAAAITWRAFRAFPPVRQNWVTSNLEHQKEPKKNILEEHLNKTDSLVIFVVGESGLGKRRLVQKAYENETIKNKFKEHIWVSFPPDTSNITGHITRKLNEVTRKLEGKCSMLPQNLDQVYDYLVVVDYPTTQSTMPKICNLQKSLKGRKGSKIVLTATSCPPADAENVVIVELGYLDKALSNRLFNHELSLARRRKSKEKTKNMNHIRDHIEEITNGLPLAVILLAKLLRTMNINKWEAASNYLRNNHQDDHLKAIVSMCIDDLPDELKLCLLYTAGFPARSMMDAGQLVRLWMAEGFLAQQQGDGVEPEDLGQRYLKEFILRGLVQVVKEKGDTVESVALLHDRVHEVFRSEAQRTGFMVTHYGDSTPLADSARCLALCSKKLPDKNMVLTKLRTVLSHGYDQWQTHHCGEQGQSTRVSCGGVVYLPCTATSWCSAVEFFHPPLPRRTSVSRSTTSHDDRDDAQVLRPEFKKGFRQLLKHSTFLRVISLEGINIGEMLPTQIGNMLHLQYLGVRCWTLKKVPGSIGKLRKLQTMDVRGTQVKTFPKSFWKIKALRQVLGDNLEVPKFALHLMMLNESFVVLPSTSTFTHHSSLSLLHMGEADKAESEESVMPPQAIEHLETVSEPEESMGEAEKAESQESVMPPQAIGYLESVSEPEQSMGEVEKAESQESVMPPQAIRYLETVSEPEQSMGEAEKAVSQESVMPPQASVDASNSLAIENKAQAKDGVAKPPIRRSSRILEQKKKKEANSKTQTSATVSCLKTGPNEARYK